MCSRERCNYAGHLYTMLLIGDGPIHCYMSLNYGVNKVVQALAVELTCGHVYV